MVRWFIGCESGTETAYTVWGCKESAIGQEERRYRGLEQWDGILKCKYSRDIDNCKDLNSVCILNV